MIFTVKQRYISEYNSYVERYEKLQNGYDYLKKKKERRLQQFDKMSYFIFAVVELDELELQFNPALWHTTVDHTVINEYEEDKHYQFLYYRGRLLSQYSAKEETDLINIITTNRNAAIIMDSDKKYRSEKINDTKNE